MQHFFWHRRIGCFDRDNSHHIMLREMAFELNGVSSLTITTIYA